MIVANPAANATVDRLIVVHTIGAADLRDALTKGWADFQAMPTFPLFLAILYPIIGLILFSVVFKSNLLQLVFPLTAGFSLIGPFAAVGLCELSRLREQGLDGEAMKLHRAPSLHAILTLGIVLMVIFFIWLGTAQAIYHLIFGSAAPVSIADFAHQVFATPAGWTLIIVGCGVGFLFAVGGADHQRRVLPDAFRQGRRRSDGSLDVGTSCPCEPDDDGNVGAHRRRRSGARLPAVPRRPRNRSAGAGSFHLAFVPQGRGMLIGV